jgi:hypothetical protein
MYTAKSHHYKLVDCKVLLNYQKNLFDIKDMHLVVRLVVEELVVVPDLLDDLVEVMVPEV